MAKFDSNSAPRQGRKKGATNRVVTLKSCLRLKDGELAREKLLLIVNNEKHDDHFGAVSLLMKHAVPAKKDPVEHQLELERMQLDNNARRLKLFKQTRESIQLLDNLDNHQKQEIVTVFKSILTDGREIVEHH